MYFIVSRKIFDIFLYSCIKVKHAKAQEQLKLINFPKSDSAA